ncbi:hypothetical protein WJX74_001932 [Apatococcus lobatus]|uniref:LITAF domain-containing protein n=2 Tax=Apatococcus TaxID=904362 RepID=A0AAW1T8Y4_9CHLO
MGEGAVAGVPAHYPNPHQQTTAQPVGYGNQVVGTQTFFQQPQTAAPAPIADSNIVGPMSTAEPLYSPPDQTGPTFLGATVGHQPIMIHCGTCGYQGWSHLRQVRGWAHGLAAVMTFGIALATPLAMDTYHDCPKCHKAVAVAKLM